MGSCLSSEGRQGSPRSPASPSGDRRLRKGSRKRLGSRSSSSTDSKRDDYLHRIPGRMFLNGASGIASLFTQQGKKGTNQDAMIVWENFGSRTDTVFCGVFDGHGPFGHLVARRVRDSLPLKLSAHWEVSAGVNWRENSPTTGGSMNSEETASVCLDDDRGASSDSEEKEEHPEIYTILKESFLKAFKVMDKELRVHPVVDCFCSGTTAVTLVKKDRDLIIGNIGDSRAILGTRDEEGSLTAVQLTVDLKPNLPGEAERIKRCKGRVFALQDEPDVARVWLPNNNSPGLAMARAFGDFCLKDFGLISVPKVSYRRLNEKDEFVVLASDGVWDVLSNKEVVDAVASAPTRSSAARTLVDSAVRSWRYKYPTSKIDDCAVVCLFLNADQSKSTASYSENKDMADLSDTLEVGNESEDPCNHFALERSGTVRSSSEILHEEAKGSPRKMGRSQSQTKSGSDISAAGHEWSALEGVSRVNTLLTLPRFLVKEGRWHDNAHHKT